MNDTIYSRFKIQVGQRPDAVAIVEDNRQFTYHELDRLVDAILSKFHNKGYKFIGIVMNHGAEMIAAILAVLKSGAAYIPAEPSLPHDRIKYMMSTAGVKLVIDDNYCNSLPECSIDYPDTSLPDSPAYVLYTSGTTGKPKGVIVTNSNVVNYSEAFEQEFHTAPGDVMLQYSVCSFDIFVEEVFTTLLNGATLAIPSREIRNGSMSMLMDFVTRHNITVISGFPYLLAEMNKLDTLPPSIRLLISGGDILRNSYIDKLRDFDVMIYNTYGPSEATVCATYYRCDNARSLPDGTFPVGKAIKGVTVKILDNNLKEVPFGKTGEICITGDGISLGYIGNPPEQSNFVTMDNGNRLYRSGDLGYILPDGNIAFLHRKDEQVMILGKRVEPEEVENVLNSSPEVERGVVCPFSDAKGLSYLVAYFVPNKGKYTLKSIKRWLASKLTDYMIPEYFVEMKEIPLTVRGKVDKKALPIVLK